MVNENKSGDTDKFDHSDHPISHATEDDMRGQGTGKTGVKSPDRPNDTNAGNVKDKEKANR